MKQRCRAFDTWLRLSLQANLEPLVALALIVLLLVGTLALTGFVTMRIGKQCFAHHYVITLSLYSSILSIDMC